MYKVKSLIEAAQTSPLTLIPLAALLATPFLLRGSPKRSSIIPPSQERVVVLGASSGVGRVLASLYAARGARVCLVARREAELKKAYAQSVVAAAAAASGKKSKDAERDIVMVIADASDATQMFDLRTRLEKEWGGLDTLLIMAGVSALRPLLETAGVERQGGGGGTFVPADCTLEGLQDGVRIASAAIKGNFLGPLVAALTFIPFMTRTSPSPSILHLSTLAAIIPMPTRSLYTSSKAAALTLLQALAIEHPEIAFTNMLPVTIEGDFRRSAVDGGRVREDDPGANGLRREDVAKRCVEAVDGGERNVFVGGERLNRLFHLMYWLWPSAVERKTRKKYNFVV
ncbi:NAD-P-binding protein [Schizopora paradoxa]|uniref:NAD-P-binding protein n=1 Tax=Schizopora paradoxa TaxID=27342 RepID=A0A0H2RB07_9AGAM|nr:NAD-P-binding protein [Schizopora paradoxa]